MTFKPPYLSKQTIVPYKPGMVQVNTYAGPERGWFIEPCNEKDRHSVAANQLIRLSDQSIDFFEVIKTVYHTWIGSELTYDKWDSLTRDEKLRWCRNAKSKLTSVN